MAYGRNTYGSGVYGGAYLVETEEITLSTSVVAEAFAVASIDVISPLTGGTATATAVATPGSLAVATTLSGTADIAMTFSASMELLIPASEPPAELTATNLQRVSPIMPIPTIVDGRPV